jgi:hypothetical protein
MNKKEMISTIKGELSKVGELSLKQVESITKEQNIFLMNWKSAKEWKFQDTNMKDLTTVLEQITTIVETINKVDEQPKEEPKQEEAKPKSERKPRTPKTEKVEDGKISLTQICKEIENMTDKKARRILRNKMGKPESGWRFTPEEVEAIKELLNK